MFSQIFDAIEEWMRELLTGMISSNLDRMFTDVNQKTSEIAGQVGQTPQGCRPFCLPCMRKMECIWKTY